METYVSSLKSENLTIEQKAKRLDAGAETGKAQEALEIIKKFENF